MGATALNARIGVSNKSALKKLMGIAKIEMVNDAVAEHRCKHLSLFRISNNESTSTAEPHTSCLADHHKGRSDSQTDEHRTS